MSIYKLTIVLLSLIATTLTCDLKSTQKEIEDRANVENYIKEKKPDIKSTYRLHYHVMPPVGWMNDPNGFSYFKNQYHLFYQFFPYNATNGRMHWGHVTSTNLVDWTQRSTALIPETEQIFSGSAIEKDGTMILMYTGRTDYNSTSFSEAQYLAFSNDGEVFNKYKNNPVIAASPDNTPDFRDPKVWKYGDYYYVILGSKTQDNKGKVLLYRSPDMGTWTFLRVLAESNGTLGYMWECPDFFPLGDKYVLLMSPQGMKADGDKYQNVYQTGYIIGRFNYDTFEFVQETYFQEIDYGHDFYATQTTERDGKRYLIAWFSMWEIPVRPEAEDGWAGAMTIFRELKLNGNRILMNPVEAITTLRIEPAAHNGILATNGKVSLNQTGELLVTIADLQQNVTLDIKGANDNKLLTLSWNAAINKVVVDRLNKIDGSPEIRQREWTPIYSKILRIFLDTSSMEVFCGEGEAVFSTRAYPSGAWQVTNLGPQNLTVTAYHLRSSVPE